MKTCEKLAVKLVDIRRIRLAYLMFFLPRNTRMGPKGKTVNIAIHLYSIAMHITFPGWCKYPWQASPPAPVGCVMHAAG